MKKTAFTILIVVLLQLVLFGSKNVFVLDKKYEPCSENKYQGNMIVTALVKCHDDVILNCEVAVFDSKGECRASELSVAKDGGFVYLSVQGEGEGEPLTFRVVYHSVDAMEDVLAEETITFVNDGVVGSYNDPFVINVNKPESIEDVTVVNDLDVRSVHDGIVVRSEKRQNVTVYNMLGVCMFQREIEGEQVISLPDGIYIVNGKKIIVK